MGGIWQHRNEPLRHVEEHEEGGGNMGISTSVLELRASAFAVWLLWSYLAIQSGVCNVGAWAFGERRL